jgi:hypothetical protein
MADLSEIALETYREEYRDLSETWKHLDTKAQGIGAIGGVFLAASFAWARDGAMSLGDYSRPLLVAGILVLVATMVVAILALLVRRVAAPPLGDETAEMVRDILEKQTIEEAPQRVVALRNDQITAWKDTNNDLASKSHSKATLVTIGQFGLVTAAVLVATISTGAILRPGRW